jgi:uncharacterized protein
MNQQTLNDELGEAELDRFAQFLADAGPTAMNLEQMDGYFAALVCAPNRLQMSKALPALWGEDFAFSGTREATEILGLAMRHWNTIATSLERTLQKPDVYLPCGEDATLNWPTTLLKVSA